MAKKNALGRGLGALIDDGKIETPEREGGAVAPADIINEIELDKVDVNPFQPRNNFDEEALDELAESIKELGIIQPVSVRLLENGRYQLITGERRIRAAKKVGIKTIPAYIREADDQSMLEMALVENIQREDLDAIEVAISYQRLIEECDLTQENLSQRVGKKRATVTNYLRLLKLPAEIQIGIRTRGLSMGHARTLINVEDPEIQLQAYQKVISDELSVRKTEELVRNLKEKKNEPPKESEPKQELPPEYTDLKNHLADFFSSKVEFKRNNNGAGKIVISFNSDEDLERIIAILDK
jgi:ParB family chromosome partitioning protein